MDYDDQQITRWICFLGWVDGPQRPFYSIEEIPSQLAGLLVVGSKYNGSNEYIITGTRKF